VDGARAAYEMIVGAFARGDRESLRSLLAPDVFESFSAAIGAREAQGETVETTFVSIDKVTIAAAHLRDGAAQITVRFASRLITLTRDRSGAIVDGGVDRIVDVVDVWTFARQAGARDPNWKLVATEAAH
jgi:predicted lipid-binding transport protein (Tim44 family)